MNPLFYTLVSIKRSGLLSNGSGINKHVSINSKISMVLSLIHHKINGGLKLAVGFPTMLNLPGLGDSIKVFAESESEIGELQDHMLDSAGFDSIADFSVVSPVPEDKIVGYEYYARFRIPCKKNSEKFSKDPEAIKKQTLTRRRRLAMSASLPFANIESRSTGRTFRLYVERGVCTQGLYGDPDGYGLSRKLNMISLPAFL